MLGLFLDTETNGLNFHKHRILEIACTIVNLRTKETIASFDSVIKQPEFVWQQSDPDSLKVNGFQYDDLDNGLPEDIAAQKIITLFKDCEINRNNSVFICQNPSFDRAFFSQLISADEQEKMHWPYHWLDLASMFWAVYLTQNEKVPSHIGLSKDKIAHFYGLNPEEKPHKAHNGVQHLIECYYAVTSNLKTLHTHRH
ncbi:MAG: 3'-5' exonuclease [Simkaniaceae bacterium]|nr:3'-5' exonuclease [Simkaniaceae bacterium]